MKQFVMLALLALAGCANAPQVAASWHGQRLDDLVATWGPPTASYQMEDGRRLVSWSDSLVTYAPVSGTFAPIRHECEVRFVAERDGRIVQSSVRDSGFGGCNHLLENRAARGG